MPVFSFQFVVVSRGGVANNGHAFSFGLVWTTMPDASGRTPGSTDTKKFLRFCRALLVGCRCSFGELGVQDKRAAVQKELCRLGSQSLSSCIVLLAGYGPVNNHSACGSMQPGNESLGHRYKPGQGRPGNQPGPIAPFNCRIIILYHL